MARSAAVATAVGITALALAGPTSTNGDDVPMAANDCETIGQLCAKTTRAVAITHGGIIVEFTASAEHCSGTVAHIIVDEAEWGSNRVGPGQSDGGYEIPVHAGTQQILVRAMGVSGGCNTGRLAS